MCDVQTLAEAATEAMRGVFAAPPLQRNAHLSDRHGADIWLKREDFDCARGQGPRDIETGLGKDRLRHGHGFGLLRIRLIA